MVSILLLMIWRTISRTHQATPSEVPTASVCFSAAEQRLFLGSQGDLLHGPALIPEHSVDGAVVGARIHGLSGSAESLPGRLTKVGMQSGDLLQTVNETAWMALARDGQLREQLATESRLSLHLARGPAAQIVVLERCVDPTKASM